VVARATQQAHEANQRSLDKITAKLYAFTARLHERNRTYDAIRV
jgi:hypothetical protein